MQMKMDLNILPQKLCVYIFVTEMAYNLSLVSNYMGNSLLLKIMSNSLVFSSTGSLILIHILNTLKISVGKLFQLFRVISSKDWGGDRQPYWGYTGHTSDPNWIMVVVLFMGQRYDRNWRY